MACKLLVLLTSSGPRTPQTHRAHASHRPALGVSQCDLGLGLGPMRSPDQPGTAPQVQDVFWDILGARSRDRRDSGKCLRASPRDEEQFNNDLAGTQVVAPSGPGESARRRASPSDARQLTNKPIRRYNTFFVNPFGFVSSDPLRRQL